MVSCYCRKYHLPTHTHTHTHTPETGRTRALSLPKKTLFNFSNSIPLSCLPLPLTHRTDIRIVERLMRLFSISILSLDSLAIATCLLLVQDKLGDMLLCINVGSCTSFIIHQLKEHMILIEYSGTTIVDTGVWGLHLIL